MKKLLLLPIITLLISCGAYKTEVVEIEPIEKVVQVEGSKNDLYVKANQWAVKTFNNAKSVIQFQDKEAGVVSGKYLFKTVAVNETVYAVDLYALIDIQVKDNAAKIKISPEPYSNVTGSFANQKLIYTKQEAIDNLNNTINDFERYMKSSSDDW